MPDPTAQELQDTINELSAYRDRLVKEVSSIGQKLQMPQKKITSVLKENTEIAKINELISKLTFQKSQ